jgi:nucleoside-diphosphate-sugar epimerase
MKIAVTGAGGFIGRHVLSELARRSLETIAVVRPSLYEDRVFAPAKVVPIDLYCPPPDAFELMGCPDVLIHLAWGGLPNYKSLHHYEIELPAQYRFLKSLIMSGLPNLIVAGTCFEYGMQSGCLSENMQSCPNNSYGFAKDSLRKELEYFKNIMPFSLTWARLFYLYGKGQNEASLFPQLKKAVEQGKSVFNMSGGEQLRDYLPIFDVANYLVSLAMLKKDIGVLNVCSGRPVAVRNLVEHFIKENNWPISLNLGYFPYPDYEPMAFWGDRQKLDNYLEQ